SNESVELTENITSIMTGSAYIQSAKMAKKLKPFPAYDNNKSSMLEVLNKHRDFAHKSDGPMANTSFDIWSRVVKETKFRNAFVTCLAPTGTIGLVMDCDTTGVEPDFSL